MGVSDEKPRRIVAVKLPTPAELQKIRDAVLDSASIRIEPVPIQTEQGWVLAVAIPPRPRGHIFSTRSGKYLTRTGEGLRGMTLAEIEWIRGEELRYRDVLAEPIQGDWLAFIDLSEIQRLRRILHEHRRGELAALPDQDLLQALEVLVPCQKGPLLTRVGVLLFGTREAMRTHLPYHEVKLQRFERDDLMPSFSEDTRAPLLATLQRAAEVVEVSNQVEPLQVGLYRVDIPRYPPLACREAIANALMHRDYEQPGNVAVRVYRGRIEVGNPGGWFGGVNEGNILVTESRRRNELLASALQRIGLAERSAIGVKRMFREMLAAGKAAPEYRSTPSSVTVSLLDGSFDQGFASFSRRCVAEGIDLSVFDLLVLAHVQRHRSTTVAEVARLCQRQHEPESARRLLDDLRNAGLLERREAERPYRYVFARRSYEWLGLVGDRPLDLGMSEQRFVGLLLDELGRRKGRGITNRELREWSHFGRMRLTRLLRRLTDEGRLVFSGKRGLGARYWLPEHAPFEAPAGTNNDAQ